MQKTFQRLLIGFLAIGGLACSVVSFVWVGCASSGGNSPPRTPPAAWSGSGHRPVPRNARFKENVIFLKEANVSVVEVYHSLGPPDWESKALRLIAYLAQNKQALFVTYGTNNVVTHHAVKKILETDSLADVATFWLRSNAVTDE